MIYVNFHVYIISLKLIWLLKLPLDQKSIIIYYKFNGDFKSHNNFGGHKVDMTLTYIITLFFKP
jgi:hypothetical protein